MRLRSAWGVGGVSCEGGAREGRVGLPPPSPLPSPLLLPDTRVVGKGARVLLGALGNRLKVEGVQTNADS